MDSLTFLNRVRQAEPRPLYVLHGDEAFLKRQCQLALREVVLGAEADDFGCSVYPGDKAEWAAVHDEVQTLPFLCQRRLVIVEAADSFVSKNRPYLEKYVGKPSSVGVLVLEVKTWTSTTKLAKLLDDQATIDCKAPASARLVEWSRQWCHQRHGKQLPPDAAQLLVDLVGPEMGLLDQEIAKLAVYVGAAAKVAVADVDQLVGNNRAENTFRIFDLIGAGQVADALGLLDRLLAQGEDPLALLGAMSWQLRKLAQAARLSAQGLTMQTALAQAGVKPFAVRSNEQLLRHLGRGRAERLYDWLLEVNLGIKGSSALSPRVLLERLVIRLAQPQPRSR